MPSITHISITLVSLGWGVFLSSIKKKKKNLYLKGSLNSLECFL